MDISGITSSYMDYADALSGTNTSKSSGSISALADKDLSKATDDELMEVCQEFEAYFMEQVMKAMFKTVGGDEESGSGAALVDYFKDSTMADLAKTATEQNSLGLARTLYEQMKRNYGIDASQVPEAAVAAQAGEATDNKEI